MNKIILITLLSVFSLNLYSQDFYPKNNSNLTDLSSWGINSDGTGTSPSSFTNVGYIFNITYSSSIDYTWTVSNLRVSSTLTLNSPTNILGVLYLNSNIITNDNLTVDLNTGSISGLGSGGITGNVSFKKIVPSDKWHYISSPVSTTLSQLSDDANINNFYKYDETVSDTNSQNGWVKISNPSSQLDLMEGYILYFYGSTEIDFTGTYNHTNSYTKTLTYTPSGNPDSDGWNLVGNPYPSTIDWDKSNGWNKDKIENAIYFWDAQNRRYASYVAGAGINGGTNYIPSMQTFFVKVAKNNGNGNGAVNQPSTGTLTVNNNARVLSNYSLWRVSSLQDYIKIKVSGSITDETVVRMYDYASDTFDIEYDAYKMKNDVVSLYSKYNGQEYSINSINLSNSFDLPLYFESTVDGIYELDFNGIDYYKSLGYEVYLTDLKTNVKNDLSSNKYPFDYLTTDNDNRFLLSFRSSITSTQDVNDTKIDVVAHENYFIVKTDKNYEIKVYDLMGNEVIKDYNDSNYYPISKTGIYIVNINMNGSLHKQKIFIK